MSDEKEKKTYTVVDRRSGPEPPAREAPPPPEKPPEPLRGEQPPEQPGPEEAARIMRVEEFIALFLNLLRDQAALSLGMPLHPGIKTPKQTDKTDFIVALTNKIMRKFGERIFPDPINVPEESLVLSKLIPSYLGMLQEYILIHIGILANPVTGLVARDLDQARLAIDFFSLVAEESQTILSPEESGRIRAVLSDLQINYARQSGI